MITVRNKKENIENVDEKVVFYPDVFQGKIINSIAKNLDTRSILGLSVGLAMLTGKVYKSKRNDGHGSKAIVVLSDNDTFKISKNSEIKSVPCHSGSVFILGSLFRKEWKCSLPKSCLQLYEENYLPDIYLNTKKRLNYSKDIGTVLEKLKVQPLWLQYPKNIFNMELIGKGCYGNVFKCGYQSRMFALKISKLKPESVNYPYDTSFSCWHEVFFLKEIFRPLISNCICPNLPFIYDSFTSDKCELIIDNKKTVGPGVITAVELASGDLKMYLQKTRGIEELYSALFQVMAALHSIQYYAQIMNFDVKKENVLYYDVVEGGYWCYIIRGKKYYVPNYGKLFVLNDFGISRTMCPKYPLYKNKEQKTFRLGSRYAIVHKGRFIPFHTVNEIDDNEIETKSEKITWPTFSSRGSEFRMKRKEGTLIPLNIKLQSDVKKTLRGIDIFSLDFFNNSEVFPPFEFYNDTQDAIRMFIGGKRTTQKGYHKVYAKLPKKFVNELSGYVGKGESMKDRIFSDDPAQVLAGYFIESFFTNYLVKPRGKILETYTISI